MPVTASSFVYDGPVQADGSRMVIELHQCANGVPDQRLIYLAPDQFDPSSLLSLRAAIINAALADAEASANMATDSTPVLNEQTATTFAQKVRAAYKNATASDACRMAYWLLRRITNGDLTDAQCQSAFGVTSAQWTNFKTNKLTPQSNAWASVIAATGS